MLEGISRQNPLSSSPTPIPTPHLAPPPPDAAEEAHELSQDLAARRRASQRSKPARSLTFEAERISVEQLRGFGETQRVPDRKKTSEQRQVLAAMLAHGAGLAERAYPPEDEGGPNLAELAHTLLGGAELLGLEAPPVAVALAVVAAFKQVEEIANANVEVATKNARRTFFRAYASGLSHALDESAKPCAYKDESLRLGFELGRLAADKLTPEQRQNLQDGLVRTRARATTVEESPFTLSMMYDARTYSDALMDVWEGVIEP